MDFDLEIAPGKPIRAAAYQGMRAIGRALRLIAGPGISIFSTPDGTTVSVNGGAGAWIHSFKVSLLRSGANIRPGTINGVPAAVGGVPLDDPAPPRLEWSEPKLNADGRGWIAAEVTCDKDWAVVAVEIVQVADLDSIDGNAPMPGAGGPSTIGGSPGLPGRKARHPLAMLVQRESGLIVCFQITHFPLQHRAQARGGAVARHFFW
jgi:hypothetical protein